MKHQFSIYETKARLSEIIRMVRQHHEVIITDRSKPVVKMIPYQQEQTKSILGRIEALRKAGHLSSTKKTPPKIHQERVPHALKTFLRERD